MPKPIGLYKLARIGKEEPCNQATPNQETSAKKSFHEIHVRDSGDRRRRRGQTPHSKLSTFSIFSSAGTIDSESKVPRRSGLLKNNRRGGVSTSGVAGPTPCQRRMYWIIFRYSSPVNPDKLRICAKDTSFCANDRSPSGLAL